MFTYGLTFGLHTLPAIPDFPKEGITFRDISPLLKEPHLSNIAEQMYLKFEKYKVDKICALESRGFLFAPLLAQLFHCEIVMVRKAGKLPRDVVRQEYNYEYASGAIEIQKDAIKKNDHVLLVDDIIVTGGTMKACEELVCKMGGIVVGCTAILQIYKGYQTKLTNLKPLLTDPSPTVCWGPPLDHSPVDHVIFFSPEMRHMEREVMKYSNNVRFIQWQSFPDGYPNMEFPNWLRNKDVTLVVSIAKMNDIVPVASLLQVLPRQGIRSLNVYLPYFAPATMERVDKAGVIATMDTVASILTSNVQCTGTGASDLNVYDLHNRASHFCFKYEGMRYMPRTAIDKILYAYDLMKRGIKWGIAFPDAGSAQRFSILVKSLFPKHPIINFSKKRVGDKRIVTVQSFENIDSLSEIDSVIILDDLVQSGGTLHECRLALVREGLKYVSAGVVHAVFPKRGFTKFYPTGIYEGFEKFFITDSIYQPVDGMEPFSIISIVDDIVPRNRPIYDFFSSSQEKIEAIKYCYNVNIRSPIPSGVSAQPLSLEETKQGAINRTVDGTPSIGIENGIWDGKDHVVCCVRRKGNLTYTFVSKEGVTVDPEVLKEFMENRSKYETVGDVYHAKFGYSSTNWHVNVCGKSRAWFIKETLLNGKPI